MTTINRPDGKGPQAYPKETPTHNEAQRQAGRGVPMIARLEVTRGTLTEYPLAEKVRGGWQNGVTFYPDSEVTKVIHLEVRLADVGPRPQAL